MSYVITIGREYGSGGRYIAQELAKRLKINFYDNELLVKVAEESGYNVDYIKENDEKKDSFFAYLALNGSTAELTSVQKVSIAQFNTIRKISETESCVIVGRCANYVLHDKENVVNVFIHAPLEKEVERAIAYYGVDEKKAKEIIIKKNKKRESYYNFFTNQKWGFSNNYDLCIDSSIGIEESVDVIECFVSKKLKNK